MKGCVLVQIKSSAKLKQKRKQTGQTGSSETSGSLDTSRAETESDHNMSSVLGGMLLRGMARRATNSTRLQSSVNLNADDRLTVYKPEEWTPPPDARDVFTTQTPEKRPMQWAVDFQKPRTPNRVSKGDRGVIMRLHHYGCKNRWMFHLVIHKVGQ